MNILLLLSREGRGINAIDQATTCLGAALARIGHETRLARWRPGEIEDDARGADVVVVPYNPFMWGRRGFAPALVRDVARIRRRFSRPEIVLVIHEPYVPIWNLKSLAMGAWQRAQLGVLLLLADARFASIERWAWKFGKIRPTAHLPSGSALPDMKGSRDSVRAELEFGGAVVVATLSSGHPTHLTEYVEAALTRLSEELGTEAVAFLQLGATTRHLVLPASIRVERPGLVSAERLGALLSAADIMMSPFLDGVSTRRTSFFAGLQQGVAIVGTSGPLTDQMLGGRGLELVPVGSSEAYAQRVCELAVDENRRRRAVEAGQRLFDREFEWDKIARRFLSGIRSTD